jgi:hypothetical protein
MAALARCGTEKDAAVDAMRVSRTNLPFNLSRYFPAVHVSILNPLMQTVNSSSGCSGDPSLRPKNGCAQDDATHLHPSIEFYAERYLIWKRSFCLYPDPQPL